MEEYLFKAKRVDNERWEKGYYVKLVGDNHHYIFTGVLDITGLYPTLCRYEVFPETCQRYTGLNDISGTQIYEGDIIESHLGGQVLVGNMVIKYGTYQAYCPADKQYMDSVGFYASKKGYPDMPIGPTEVYAKVVGNIYDNPELLDD